MSEEKGKTLDDLLQSRPTARPQLPAETAAAVQFVRIEQVLLAAIDLLSKKHTQALEVVKQNILTVGNPDVLEEAARVMTSTRIALVTSINDYGAFTTDPAKWLADMRASGRIAEWTRFGIK